MREAKLTEVQKRPRVTQEVSESQTRTRLHVQLSYPRGHTLQVTSMAKPCGADLQGPATIPCARGCEMETQAREGALARPGEEPGPSSAPGLTHV